MESIGPQLPYSEQLHSQKYRNSEESFSLAMKRIAHALKDSQDHYYEFRDILYDMRFLPAGRVQSAMGAPKNVTPYNCFVGGTIPDSFTSCDNVYNSSIMHRATEGAVTMRLGGGLGNDFSTLRPRGARIEKINSTSSGPIEFMKIFDGIGNATSSTGERRGAQMGVLRIDHPDIMEFINAKQDNSTLTRFNISVAVTDKFMECLQSGAPFPLTFNGEIYKYIDPEELWETLMHSTWNWAEPGVLFIDGINRLNNLWYCETISATNPCGEQPLPPHGACLLGSFNLTKYIRMNSHLGNYFDWDQFKADIPIVVRAMDNIVDRATYPLLEQEQEAKNKRRMGLGGTGLANTIEALGYSYGSPDFILFQEKINHVFTTDTYLASVELAKEKGSFPLYDKEKYSQGEFIKTLDSDVKEQIAKYGIRNSHLISWAPTGTISMTADNVSSSLEPVYQWKQTRPVNLPEGKVIVDMYDYAFREWRIRGKRAANGEVTTKQHVDVLVTAQKYTDSSVSKTINTDGNISWKDFKNVYLDAYNRGAKGCTTFNKDGKRFGLFKPEVEPDDLPFPNVEEPKSSQPDMEFIESVSCTFDPSTGKRTCE